MAKIDELLQELCPDGVEFYPLWRVTAWDKKFNGVDKSMQEKIVKYKYLLAKDLENIIDVNGNVRILYTTTDVAFTTEEKAGEFISEGEIVAIPWGGNVSVKYYKGKFVTGDNRIATSLDTSVLDNKYLFFWMENNIDLLSSFYRGAGIKHPSMLSVLNLEIPIPHINIQHYIVETLDTFTDAISNLEEELALREKQCEYYREQLFNFDDETSLGKQLYSYLIDWQTLSEVAEIGTGISNTKDGLSQGLFPFYTRGQDILWKNEYEFDEEAVITAGDGVGVGKTIHYVKGKYALHQRAYRFSPKKTLLGKFLFYYMKVSFYKYVCGQSVSSSVSSLRKPKLMAYPIPILPIEKQQEIVEILDTFEAMIANIKEEIALRTKQYEYYREKLLSFGK